MATSPINPGSALQLGLPNNPTFFSPDQELNIEFTRLYNAIKILSLNVVPPGTTAGYVLTTGGPGTTPTWQPAGGGGGGLVDWVESQDSSAPYNNNRFASQFTPKPPTGWTGLTGSNAIISPGIGTGGSGGRGGIATDISDGTALGGNVRGDYTVDLQLFRTAATQVTNANYSGLFAGQSNEISAGGASVILGGVSNTINGSGHSAIVGGFFNVNFGQYCFIGAGVGIRILTGLYIAGFGNGHFSNGGDSSFFTGSSHNIAGQWSHVHGAYADDRGYLGSWVWSSGQNGFQGDVQMRKMMLHGSSQGTTPIDLCTGNASNVGGSTNQVPCPVGFCIMGTGQIICRNRTSGAGAASFWNFFFTAINNSGTITVNPTITNVSVGAGMTGVTPTIVADNANNSVKFRVVGLVAITQMTCSARVEVTEMT